MGRGLIPVALQDRTCRLDDDRCRLIEQVIRRVAGWSQDLVLSALLRLAQLDCGNVAVRVGDGAEGWPKHAPFDRILLTAAAAALPSELVQQLAPRGRMVLPLGSRLVVVDKRPNGGLERSSLMPVRYVPLRTAPMIAFEAAG
jgi:protein-L-isoaspartate O-methyltransferase